MGLTKLEEILEENLDFQYIEQGAIPSIKECCRLYSQLTFKDTTDVLTTEIMVLREKNAELTSLLSKIVKGYKEAGGEMWIPDHIGNYITQAESLINSNITE